MAWAGTGLVWTIAGGVADVAALGQEHARLPRRPSFTFVQISDSHIGFNKPANPDVTATLEAAVAKINALPEPPDFLLHTGDITHLSKPDEFDDADQILEDRQDRRRSSSCPASTTSSTDDGKPYLRALRQGQPRATAGTASTRRACTSSAWSTW